MGGSLLRKNYTETRSAELSVPLPVSDLRKTLVFGCWGCFNSFQQIAQPPETWVLAA